MKRALAVLFVVSSLGLGAIAEASFRLERADGHRPRNGIAVQNVVWDSWRLPAAPKPAPARRIQPAAPQTGSGKPSGASPWDCIARYESGNQPLGCAPYCGRLQWLPSTWRMAGGTKYAALPQNATWEQEKAIAASWLAKTSWAQWPSTSRRCGYR